jgi:hypothetical protein
MKKLYKVEYSGTALVYIDEDFLPGLIANAERALKTEWSSGPEVVGFEGVNGVELILTAEQIPTEWADAIPVGGSSETCSDIVNNT